MKARWIIAVWAVLNFLTNGAYGQLGMVGSPCYSSGTCFGYTTCQQQRCMCTSGYQQIGQSCMSMGGGGMGIGGGYPVAPIGIGMGGGCMPGMSGCGMGIGGSLVYPGHACGSTMGSCGYGSFCQGGICCCPTGYSQTLTGCIPGAGMGMGGMGMGMGMGGMGYGMGGGGYGLGMGGLGYGMGMGMGMGGYGMGGGMMPMGGCSSGMCMPMYGGYGGMGGMGMGGMGMGGMGMGGMGMGGLGGLGMGGLGGQITLSINVGGYCQPSSMMSHCVMGASCIQSSCRCMGDFYSQGMLCVRRRLRKDPNQSTSSSEQQQPNKDKDAKKEEEEITSSPQPPSVQTINDTFSSPTSNGIRKWSSKS